ncbi:hypothetical protein GGF38_004806, partial [Coemansia sp. RSA 25]
LIELARLCDLSPPPLTPPVKVLEVADTGVAMLMNPVGVPTRARAVKPTDGDRETPEARTCGFLLGRGKSPDTCPAAELTLDVAELVGCLVGVLSDSTLRLLNAEILSLTLVVEADLSGRPLNGDRKRRSSAFFTAVGIELSSPWLLDAGRGGGRVDGGGISGREIPGGVACAEGEADVDIERADDAPVLAARLCSAESLAAPAEVAEPAYRNWLSVSDPSSDSSPVKSLVSISLPPSPMGAWCEELFRLSLLRWRCIGVSNLRLILLAIPLSPDSSDESLTPASRLLPGGAAPATRGIRDSLPIAFLASLGSAAPVSANSASLLSDFGCLESGEIPCSDLYQDVRPSRSCPLVGGVSSL